MRPESFSIDAFAPSSVSVSTKAKPRGRPVSRSRATRTLRSWMPSPVNASRSSCSVTLYERLPMKSRVPISVMPAVVPDVSFRGTLRGRPIHLVSELFAGLESRHTAGLDLNRGAGLRIAPGACGRLADGEGAEAAEIDPLAPRESIGNCIDQRVDSGFDLGAGQVLLLRDDVDEISLLHEVGFLLGVGASWAK